jgi:hypothetical protein
MLWTFAGCFVAGAASVAAAQDCSMHASFTQSDPRGARTVLFDESSLVFSSKMKVDADGGPHTYSAKDPAGNLCDPRAHQENANKDPAALGCALGSVCVGLEIRTPKGAVLDYKNCPSLLLAFRRVRDSKWSPPVGWELRPIGIEMRTRNVPCLDENGAYITSTSSTPSGVGGGLCDQKKWLDTTVPSIVVPKCWSNAYRGQNPRSCANVPAPGIKPDVEVGDLVALRGRSSGKTLYAVIGDLGPNSQLGEASVGLLMQAAGQVERPTYLRATNLLDQREQFDAVIFKHSQYEKPLALANTNEMAAAAEDAFKSWGGNLTDAEKRLSVCGNAASR